MSREKYEDDCVLCRPILIDPITRTILPEGTPEMQAILKVWDGTTPEQRQAWHRITCDNSRDPADQALVSPVVRQMSEAVKALGLHGK